MKISGLAISSSFFISLLWKLKKYRVVSSISMEHKTVCFYYDVLLMVTVERPYENVGDMSQHNNSNQNIPILSLSTVYGYPFLATPPIQTIQIQIYTYMRAHIVRTWFISTALQLCC